MTRERIALACEVGGSPSETRSGRGHLPYENRASVEGETSCRNSGRAERSNSVAYLTGLLDPYADELNESTRSGSVFCSFCSIKRVGGRTRVDTGAGAGGGRKPSLRGARGHADDGLRVVEFGVAATAGETPGRMLRRRGRRVFCLAADPAAYDPARLRSVLEQSPEID